jgi:hypothetical protein
MFDQAIEILSKTTEAALQGQQELVRKWSNLFMSVPWSPADWAKTVKVQKEWADFATELTRKQCEFAAAQFNAGLKNMEEACRLTEAKDHEELRTKAFELWQKTIDGVRQAWEAQVRDFQAAVVKCSEIAAPKAA